jgi:hypothetical protein
MRSVPSWGPAASKECCRAGTREIDAAAALGIAHFAVDPMAARAPGWPVRGRAAAQAPARSRHIGSPRAVFEAAAMEVGCDTAQGGVLADGGLLLRASTPCGPSADTGQRQRRGYSPDPRGYGRRPAARSKRRSRASVMCATGRRARLRHGGPVRSRSSYARTTRASFLNHSSRSCSGVSAGSFPRAEFSLFCSWRTRRATTR